ncbi:MAG: ImmA/IrrE family metallo-endopeptidase [Terracidiphilus sp.]
MTRQLTGIRADRKESYRSIEQKASALRELIGLGPLDRFDARYFFDQFVPEMTVECGTGNIALCEAIEDCQQEGLTRWSPDLGALEFVLSEQTYELLQVDHVRARSTVAHESGHACLHTDQIIRLGGMSLISQVAFHRERYPHQAFEDTEWQANAFGSALLMPAEGVARLFTRLSRQSASALADKFGVSLESATYRIGTYERALGR